MDDKSVPNHNSPNSSRNLSPVQEPKAKPLLFVHINHPREAAAEETRKKVRSFVASDSGSSSRNDNAAKQRERRKRKARTATLELDTNDLPQPDSASSSHLNTPSYGSPTPSPSLGAGGRVDPFRSFPVPWHSCIPGLVDHYLVHIASDVVESGQLGSRGALRKSWWPNVMIDAGLFYATLLAAASHQMTVTSTPPSSVLLQWLRGNAITSINESMADPRRRLSDVTIGAVLTLGSWEFHHADPMAYRMHMTGLQTMIRMRGGLEQANLGDVLISLILSVGHDLALFAGVEPYFERPHGNPSKMPELENQPRSPLLLGFERLDKLDLLVTDLLTYLRHLNDFVDPNIALSAVEVTKALDYFRNWESCTLLVPFCPFESDLEDEVLLHAHKYIILAGTCFLRVLVQHRGMQPDDFPDLQIRVLSEAAANIDPSLLIKSIYAELVYWAIFTIDCVIRDSQLQYMDGLVALVRHLGISNWMQSQHVLASFLYFQNAMDPLSQHTWNRIVKYAESKPLENMNDLRLSPSSPLHPPTPERPTRYDICVAQIAFPDLEPFTLPPS